MNYAELQKHLSLKDTAGYLTDNCLKRDVAWPLIRDESNAQYKKWGCRQHHMFDWLAFITEENGELSQAMSKYLYRGGDLEAVMKEAVQAATLAIKVACMVKQALDGVC